MFYISGTSLPYTLEGPHHGGPESSKGGLRKKARWSTRKAIVIAISQGERVATRKEKKKKGRVPENLPSGCNNGHVLL